MERLKTLKFRSESSNVLRLLRIACIVLIVLHGIGYPEGPIPFKVDAVTIILLVLCFLPSLQKILFSLKAGGIEVQFREYSVHEQIFIFLDGIASKQTWTFYTPRKGEVALGQGFKVLIDELFKNKKKELIDQVKIWLESKNDNHKWFAAEVIGYSKIEELKDACKSYFEKLDINEYWEAWQLNCLWAYSTFYKYEPLIEKLRKPELNEANRLWMIDACNQMIMEEKDEKSRIRLEEVLEQFPEEHRPGTKVKTNPDIN